VNSREQHIDLIGAYRPSMREVDDGIAASARVCRQLRHNVNHIGSKTAKLA
jgi:ornithine cyclodeaminase/alanine dehydrogenase-like protein (mu-crystallin family)